MRRLLVHYGPGESGDSAEGEGDGEGGAVHLKMDGVQSDIWAMFRELFDTLEKIGRYGKRRFSPDAVHDDSSVHVALYDIRAHLRGIRETVAALDQLGIADPEPSAGDAVAAGDTVATVDTVATDAETSAPKVCLPPSTRAIVARHLAPLILMKFEIPYRLNLQELLLYLLEIGEGQESSSSELYTWLGAHEENQRKNAAFAFRRSMPMLANRGLIELLPVPSHKTKRFALKRGAIGTLDRELLRVNLQRAAIEVAGKAEDPRVTADVVMSFFQTLLETPNLMTILDALRDAPMVSVKRQDTKTTGEVEAMVPILWPSEVVQVAMKELLSQSLLHYGFIPTQYHLDLGEFLLLKGEGAVSTMQELLDWYLPNNPSRPALEAARNGFYYAMRALQAHAIVQVVPGTVNQIMLMPEKLPQVEGAWRKGAIRKIVDLAEPYLSPPFTPEWLTRELEANRSLPELVAALMAPQMVPAVAAAMSEEPAEAPEEAEVVAEEVAPDDDVVEDGDDDPDNDEGDAPEDDAPEDDAPEDDTPDDEDDAPDDDPSDQPDEEAAALDARIARRDAENITFPGYVLEQLTNPNHPIHKLGVGRPFHLPKEFSTRSEVYKRLAENDQLPGLLQAFGFHAKAWQANHVLIYFEGGDSKKPKLKLLNKSAFNPDRNGLAFDI